MLLSSTLPADYQQMQIVVSYDTDRRYHFRCLPGHLTKRYMNRHVFKGKDHPYQIADDGAFRVENEIAIRGRHFSLYERQIYDLFCSFDEYGEDETFGELSDHVRYIAAMQRMYQQDQSIIDMSSLRTHGKDYLDATYHELIHEVSKQDHTLELKETVAAQTLLLLGYTPRR